MRKLLNSPQQQWIVLDGPVDSSWIESINTLLDDNRKLCLSNGKVLNLPAHISVLFETEDLIQAAPGTVSRCGIVYFESQGGVAKLVQRWWMQ